MEVKLLIVFPLVFVYIPVEAVFIYTPVEAVFLYMPVESVLLYMPVEVAFVCIPVEGEENNWKESRLELVIKTNHWLT